MKTAAKRLRLLAHARACETAALEVHDPQAIELAYALTGRALELVDDLDDPYDDQPAAEAAA